MLKKGTRWTKQIKVVVDIVYESDRPLSADEVYRKARRRIANISLGTVYRNLNKLVDEGLVAETQNNGISTFCRHPFPNAHFECDQCHKLVSVPVELNILELSRQSGMRVERWSLHLGGSCKECESRCT
jgi:Fe2+ or Zn2+ uptake regulation protein